MFRTSLFALIGASLLSPALAESGPTYADPAPRYIVQAEPMKLGSSLRMAGLRDRINARFADEIVDVRMEKDHVLLRFPEESLFDGPGDHVSRAGIKVLTGLVEELLRHPRSSVHVIGHFHDAGDKFASQISSQRRAMSVVSVLDSRTLPRERVSVTAMGASYPLDSNYTPEGRAENRRIEIVLRPLSK